MTSIDMYDGRTPKRGDLVQTNVGDRRERTWLVLRVRRCREMPKGVPRFKMWLARWWELEVDMRLKLARSAERNGGQIVVHFKRYAAKKKRTFEQSFEIAMTKRSALPSRPIR